MDDLLAPTRWNSPSAARAAAWPARLRADRPPRPERWCRRRHLELAAPRGGRAGERSFSCPKAPSRSARRNAAQFTLTNGPPANGLDLWTCAASNSLPVPDSPISSTRASDRAAMVAAPPHAPRRLEPIIRGAPTISRSRSFSCRRCPAPGRSSPPAARGRGPAASPENRTRPRAWPPPRPRWCRAPKSSPPARGAVLPHGAQQVDAVAVRSFMSSRYASARCASGGG